MVNWAARGLGKNIVVDLQSRIVIGTGADCIETTECLGHYCIALIFRDI